jgi:hypothetical protein
MEALILALFGEHILGLYSKGCMGHKAKTLLGDELACNTAYAISLVLDAHKSCFEILDELVLTLSELAGFFFG